MKMRFWYILLPLLMVKVVCVNAQEQPWFNTCLSTEERVEALVNEMTLDEKINQLMNAAPGIDRLGVLPFDYWNECLHGVARTGRSTVFPQAIGLAATFDEELIFNIATAISDEARAKFSLAQKMQNYSRYAGLTFWSPNINIFRDPRWGRGQETYGEDPYLTSRIGLNFIKGLQGDDPKYLKAAACAKHYVVHSGPEELRHEFDAQVSMKDLWETYLPAFEVAVKDANVEAIMGAYNRTNGESCSASPYLLTEVLRDKWNFEGHVVSDCGAVSDIWKFHKLVETSEEASALAIKAGLQLNCGSNFNSLNKAVGQGLITEKEIDEALITLLTTRFDLGLFDPAEENPYTQIGEEVINCEKHVDLALQAAQNSMVLLKNQNQILPLDKNIRNLYVVGPQAANAEVLLGNYYGLSGNTVNFLDGITSTVSAGTTVNYKYGQMPFQKNINPIDWATGYTWADAIVAVMGINGMYEGEEGEAIASGTKGDKEDIKLPQAQIDFVKKLAKRTEGIPLILVVTGGSPIAMPEIFELADAVLYTWYPGEQGGAALADIMFGEVSPSGKLPFTVPYSVEDLPAYEDYAMKGRTYRYMEKEPQFTFGFGLTYADFNITNLQIPSPKVKKGESLDFEVDVVNSAKIDAEEVVQVYVAQMLGMENQPISSLKAFKRIPLKAGEDKKVKFSISYDDLKLVNDKGEKKVFKGKYRVIVGNASPGKRSESLGAKFVEAEFELK